VGDGDFFWEANGRAQFPKMAEDVDVQLNKYKAAVEELNRKTGANVDADMDPNELMQASSLTQLLCSQLAYEHASCCTRAGAMTRSGSGAHLPPSLCAVCSAPDQTVHFVPRQKPSNVFGWLERVDCE